MELVAGVDAEQDIAKQAAQLASGNMDLAALMHSLESFGEAVAEVLSQMTLRGGGVREDAVVETVSRDGLWAVQTPQAFPAASFREALAAGGDASDCAGLVEARGGRVKVVRGDPRLLKVTDRADLELVASWL